MPRVLNIHSSTLEEIANAVYCGNGSPYANPYKIGLDGDRDDVCELFEEYVLPGLDVSELKGKDLLCFCKPKRCHCDTILKKANQ